MGLFDALFGSKKPTNVEVTPDRIWMTTDAKFTGLQKEAVERSESETVAILLVAHFPDVLARLNEFANNWKSDVPLKAVLASSLNADLAASLGFDESAIIDVIVGERHPLPSVDDRLEQFADELPCRCRFSHHISLDDPIMEIFAGDSVKNILSKLGMAENEAIESKMVSRRIRQAQQKIEGKSTGSSDAVSAAQWLKKNCPELQQRT
ncbi:preprotein translocase subunit SecA [Novipirellula aureliae]|uniref:Preprotein translocase subunit SecA n=1 Tax=Novipirellula aureliae TaxID=2527966 RepID=A0A5C6E5N3_9BACT|nr:preprotein translocase subunit SecA [Novipirellula aureliae]TWU44140.1 preprotein translocase subunit SecA [Novipirellula aureliae]